MPRTYVEIKKLKEADPEYAERLRGYARAYAKRNLEKERERYRKYATKHRSENRESYNAYMREWNAKNKERINAAKRERRINDPRYAEKVREKGRKKYADNPNKHKNVRLKSVYGISLEIYNEMYESQNGKCAICETHKPSYGRGGLAVDHCHTTGKVRKLLCTRCNTALGKLKDNVNVLQNAINYLMKHQ